MFREAWKAFKESLELKNRLGVVLTHVLVSGKFQIWVAPYHANSNFELGEIKHLILPNRPIRSDLSTNSIVEMTLFGLRKHSDEDLLKAQIDPNDIRLKYVEFWHSNRAEINQVIGL